MSVIEVRGLTKRFGRVLAVDQLSFEVEPGTVAGFLGSNGAGKTTALRMLLGLVRPDAGTATINGQPYRTCPSRCTRSARCWRRPASTRAGPPVTTCASRPWRPRPTRPASTRCSTSSISTDAADRRVGGFSLGMRQRLGLATALLADPEVLILDEPANGLDPDGVRWLRDLLRGLAAEGATVLVSSHILAEVAQTVDSVSSSTTGAWSPSPRWPT